MTTKKQSKPRRLTVEQMAERFAKITSDNCRDYLNTLAGYLAGYRACQRRNRRAKR